MKVNWLRSTCVAGLVIAGTALAQTPDITSFSGNGTLTWTNSNTNLFYRVEWASTLTAPDAWKSNYCALTDIRSSDAIVTSSVPMFYRVCGNSNRLVYPSPIPKTGQTNSYQSGDDGAYKKGIAWPNPRFTVGTSGDETNCVTDNLTGLVWARNANLGGVMSWSNAITYCEALDYGGQTDWRLPNVKELYSLIDLGRSTPALPSGHPFTGAQSDYYWSSSTHVPDPATAWSVHMHDGWVSGDGKTFGSFVWPVRGGL